VANLNQAIQMAARTIHEVPCLAPGNTARLGEIAIRGEAPMLDKLRLVIGGPATTLYLLVVVLFLMILGYAAG
jgi:hypothetical protein